MRTTQHGDDKQLTAASMQAESLITISASGQSVVIMPDELRQILQQHSPDGFYE